jgi:GR25 family glycosyltransferase involved in LPS biosynthesis
MNIVHVITNGDKVRIKQTITALETYNLSYKLHEIPRHPTNGRLGCFLSHITLYRYAQKHNMDYICIAEDNICSSHNIEHYHSIQKDLQLVQQTSWEIIYLGGWITVVFGKYYSTPYTTLYETHNPHGLSFYLIHKRLYQPILSCYKKYSQPNDITHIDTVINVLAKKSYVAVPLLFYRDYQLKTTNLYTSYPLVNNALSVLHYYCRQPYIINFLQKCAIYWKFFIFSISILVGLLVYFLVKKIVRF